MVMQNVKTKIEPDMKKVTFTSKIESELWFRSIPSKSLSLMIIKLSPDLKTITVFYK